MGFHLDPANKEALQANLSKLCKYMDTFLAGCFKSPLEQNYVDVELIAETGNRVHLLRLVLWPR